MDANTFKNGLIGHKVERIAKEGAPRKIYTVIDKVLTGAEQRNDNGTFYVFNADDYVVMDEHGCIHLLSPNQIVRVILPVNEPRLPTNDFERAIFGMQDVTKVVSQMAKERAAYLKAQKEGNEPQKPANTYDWDNFDDVMRLQGFLQNVGYKVSMTDDDKMIADKDYRRIKIDETGVYLIARLPEDPRAGFVYDAHNGITIPLNEWVKNPTIEALMPQKDN